MGGHVISITLRELGEDHGYFDGGKLEIHIDNTAPDTLQAETFIHEIIEAACFFTETKLPHPTIQSFGLLIAQALDSACHGEIEENGVVGIK